MKQFLFFLVFALCSASAEAQIRRYTTQGQVDSIGFNDIYGIDLIIGPDTCCSDIHDLSPLHNFYGTESSFTIQNNPHLQSLHGLEQLKYLQHGGVISIINNDSLTNLVGLTDSFFHFPSPSQNSVFYLITDNERLTDLQGIPKSSRAAFDVRRNAALTSFDGCQRLHYLTRLNAIDCPNLQSFHGLEGIDTLFSTLFLRYLPRLKNLAGLQNCRWLVGGIDARRLDSLENTAGLGSLRMTNGNLYFDSCARFRALTDLERLGLNSFGTGIKELKISNCPWFGDFSGLSDTTFFYEARLSHVDSIETVQEYQRLHAHIASIGPAYNLRYLDALPWGVSATYGSPEKGATFGAGQCPHLLYIRDTLPGRLDTMYNLGFGRCPQLADITGLRYVKGLTNELGLNDFEVDSLIGLENLASCYRVFLTSNKFKDLQFLRGLDSVATILSIGGEVGSLVGLEHLRTVSELSMSGYASLRDLSPLEDSLRIKSFCYIFGKNNLDSITGFNSVPQLSQSVGANQYAGIQYCTKLQSISGFQGVYSLLYPIPGGGNNNVVITNNPALKKVTGFRNLGYLKKGINISNNDSLSDISGFCHLFQHGVIGGIKTIHDNAPGANSLDEALERCNTSATIEADGRVAVAIYPNPASTQFTVQIGDVETARNRRVVVFDLAGQVRLMAGVDGEHTVISCAMLPPGLYLVQVWSEGSSSRPVKLVITDR